MSSHNLFVAGLETGRRWPIGRRDDRESFVDVRSAGPPTKAALCFGQVQGLFLALRVVHNSVAVSSHFLGLLSLDFLEVVLSLPYPLALRSPLPTLAAKGT